MWLKKEKMQKKNKPLFKDFEIFTGKEIKKFKN